MKMRRTHTHIIYTRTPRWVRFMFLKKGKMVKAVDCGGA